VHLGDRVLGSATRTEAVADRLEVRLEHRLQHQHEGGLDQPVHRGRYAQAAELPPLARLGNHPLPHRQGRERPGPELLADLRQERHDVCRVGDEGRDNPVHPRRPAALVGSHPFPGHHEEGRVADEVEQIIEPAGGIASRPSVQFGLHPLYPLPGRQNVRPGRLTSIHQCLQSLQCLACMNPLGPFAMRTAFPPSDYYGPSAPPAAVSRRRAVPHVRLPDAAGRRGPLAVPTFTAEPIGRLGSQLCPCGLAMPTPQAFGMASRPTTSIRARSSPPAPGADGCAPPSSPYLPDLSWRTLS